MTTQVRGVHPAAGQVIGGERAPTPSVALEAMEGNERLPADGTEPVGVEQHDGMVGVATAWDRLSGNRLLPPWAVRAGGPDGALSAIVARDPDRPGEACIDAYGSWAYADAEGISDVKRRTWRILVPVLAAVGLAAAALPAVAGELDHDRDNNRLQTRMSFHCNSNHTVRLSWHSISPKAAARMTAGWVDGTTNPDLLALKFGSVHRSGGRASGSFTIPAGHNGHQIWLFVDALDRNGNQITNGIGRNFDTIHC
jgi:hypothetical protein